MAAHAAAAVLIKVEFFSQPSLELRFGNAAQFDGTPAGAPALGNIADAPIIIPPPGALADAPPTSTLLAPPPLEAPPITPHAPTLDHLAGTDSEPLPALPTQPITAPASLNRPPIAIGPLITDEPRSASENNTAGDTNPSGASGGSSTLMASVAGTNSSPSKPIPASGGTPGQNAGQSASAAQGKGSATGDGGGRTGVPDGVPMPSEDNRSPRYPEKAYEKDWSGTVTLEISIDATGQVTDVRILASSGHDILDNEAVSTARSWKFQPARLNGTPIPVRLTRPINFNITRRGK